MATKAFDQAFDAAIRSAPINSNDGWPAGIPIPVGPMLGDTAPRKCSCKRKKKKAPLLLLTGASLLAGYGLAMIASR